MKTRVAAKGKKGRLNKSERVQGGSVPLLITWERGAGKARDARSSGLVWGAFWPVKQRGFPRESGFPANWLRSRFPPSRSVCRTAIA
jgi:hypothetical protein